MLSLTPISPAQAGAQIRPEDLGISRQRAASGVQPRAGSIWILAFAGTVGSEQDGTR